MTLLMVLGVLGIGDEGEKLIRAFAVLGPVGLGVFAAGAVRLPAWARVRDSQMDAIADQVREMVALPDGAEDGKE